MNDNVQSIEEQWTQLKDAIAVGAEEAFGYQKARTTKKEWITEEMLNKMDERRKWKYVNTEYGRKEYKRLNKELRRETDRAVVEFKM